MWDLIVSVPDHCLSFYFLYFVSSHCRFGVRMLSNKSQNLERNQVYVRQYSRIQCQLSFFAMKTKNMYILGVCIHFFM